MTHGHLSPGRRLLPEYDSRVEEDEAAMRAGAERDAGDGAWTDSEHSTAQKAGRRGHCSISKSCGIIG